MADTLSQDGRAGSLATPLGKDVLALTAFDGVEGVGELFEFRVRALSTQNNIDFNQLIGVNLSVHLNTSDDVGRDFSGVLVEARSLKNQGGSSNYAYRLVLKPWLWLLSHTSDCRIFSSMKPTDIIKKVFSDRGFSDFRDATTQSYPTLEYCVQYRETDLNFVLRLMEEYGIYYFFEFEQGSSGGSSPTKHTLVLADSRASHQQTPGLSSVPYVPVTSAGASGNDEKQQFNDWSAVRDFESGRFVLNDYYYEEPGKNLVAEAEHSGGYAHGAMEMYDYPGDYEDQDEGKTLAAVRLDADQSKDDRRQAAGYVPSLCPGYTVSRTSTGGDTSDDKDYLVLHCTHAYGSQSYASTSSDGGAAYAGSYELMSSDRQFRMPLVTKKAVIYGCQPALVVGKEGEEIDVDKEGRICVQFYWDRKKMASRRIRVAQFWAGKDRGAWFVPRIGDEVVVQYEEGDPDRPIVVGSVYNGANPLTLHMPDEKNKSGLLTKSTKNSNGYNFLLFNDTVGSEVVKLRAQKDLMFRALNNEQRDILGSQTENVTGNETISVGILPQDPPPDGPPPPPGGNFTLNALQTATINVGPILPDGSCPVPLTQIAMTTTTITLNLGPQGIIAQILMSPAGIKLSYGPGGAAGQVMIGPVGVTITPLLTTPLANIGAGTVGGVLPLI